MMHFKVCGPLSVVDDDIDRTPTAPKIRRVLALLLLRANQSVSLDAFIDELWGDEPPVSAVAIVQTYVYQLRRAYDADDGSSWLHTSAPGYQVRINPVQLDLHTFQTMAWDGRRLLAAGQAEEASRTLRAALDVWNGSCLENILTGRLLRPYAVRLEEERLRAQELRVTADIQLGRHAEVIADLRSLVATHPLNERFHGQLIEALGNTGRRSEALQAYQDLRVLLNEQLGIDPQPEIQRLHRQVLSYGEPTPRTQSQPILRSALATA